MTTATRRVYAIALCVILALASACSPATRVTYIPDGASFGATDLTRVLESADIGDAQDIDPGEVPKARQDALADLRTHGEQAAALADTLTRDFPMDLNAVPVEVQSATFEGEDVWVVVEAWGDPGEPLTMRRLWVYSADDLTLVSAHSIR